MIALLLIVILVFAVLTMIYLNIQVNDFENKYKDFMDKLTERFDEKSELIENNESDNQGNATPKEEAES